MMPEVLTSKTGKNTGEVSLLPQSGATDEDKKVTKNLVVGLVAGKTVIAAVFAACGQEQIVGVKFTD